MKKNYTFWQSLLFLLISILILVSNYSLPITIISFSLYVISLGWTIISKNHHKKTKKITIIFASIGLFFSFLPLLLYDELNTELSPYMASLLFLSFFSSVTALIMVISSLLHRSNNSNLTIKDNIKYYPIGHISMKQCIFCYSFWIIQFLLCTFGIYYSIHNEKWWLIFIITLYFVITFVVFIILLNQYLVKLITKFNKTLDFNAFQEAFLSIYHNKKIHPETKNYYLLLFLSFATDIDKSIVEKYKDFVSKPTVNQYLLQYDLYILNSLSEDEWTTQYQQILATYRKNKAVVKLLEKVELVHRIVTLHEELIDIDVNTLFPTNAANQAQSGINTFIQAMYYYNKKDNKRFILRDLFIEHYSVFQELVKELELLDNSNQEM